MQNTEFGKIMPGQSPQPPRPSNSFIVPLTVVSVYFVLALCVTRIFGSSSKLNIDCGGIPELLFFLIIASIVLFVIFRQVLKKSYGRKLKWSIIMISFVLVLFLTIFLYTTGYFYTATCPVG
jgi:hypothetical protein